MIDSNEPEHIAYHKITFLFILSMEDHLLRCAKALGVKLIGHGCGEYDLDDTGRI